MGILDVSPNTHLGPQPSRRQWAPGCTKGEPPAAAKPATPAPRPYPTAVAPTSVHHLPGASGGQAVHCICPQLRPDSRDGAAGGGTGQHRAAGVVQGGDGLPRAGGQAAGCKSARRECGV